MIITLRAVDAIRVHAEETYPEECCGYLLGHATASGNKAGEIFPVHNNRLDNRERRFLMGPTDYLNAERLASDLKMDVVGTYHSHPDHPAQPSETDLAEATFPFFSYVIVSVRKGEAKELTSWLLDSDRTRFLEDKIVTEHENQHLEIK